MRILIISATVLLATAAFAQERATDWTTKGWGSQVHAPTPGATGATGSGSILDRLQPARTEEPGTESDRRERWLEKYRNRGRGGAGSDGEGAGGDAGGAGGHG